MGSPARHRQNVFIAAFLLFQIAAPLSYYLGGRGADERFSWRMFSTVRMHRCRVDVEALEAQASRPRRIDPQTDVQVAWINMLKRFRPAVVHKYLARACEREGARAIVYRRACRTTDGSPLPVQALTRTCATGETVTGEAVP